MTTSLASLPFNPTEEISPRLVEIDRPAVRHFRSSRELELFFSRLEQASAIAWHGPVWPRRPIAVGRIGRLSKPNQR